MTNSSGTLQTRHSTSPFSHIVVGNGATVPISTAGSGAIPTPSTSLSLHNILYSPSIIKNLVSVRALTHDNFVSVEFDPFGFSIKDLHSKAVILRCDSTGDLNPLRLPPPNNLAVETASVDLWHRRLGHPWHRRLGHPGHSSLNSILSQVSFTCNKSATHTCHACQLGKHTRLSFYATNYVSYFPFQLLHADVWTSPVPSNSGYTYYLVILDDYSHYTWTFPMRNKSEVLTLLLSFHAFVATQFQRPILALQTNNGREFDNTAMRSFFAAHAIVLRISCLYTSQQNEKAERVLCTINDSIRSLLFQAAMPPWFWVEALSTATYLLNRRPCTSTGARTPYELHLGLADSVIRSCCTMGSELEGLHAS